MKSLLLKICMFAALSLAASCGGIAQKIGPLRVESVELHGLSGVDATLEINNSSAHRIRIKRAEAMFHYDGAPVGKVALVREFTIEKRRLNTLNTRWRLRFKDLSMARMLVRRIENRHYDKIAISYKVTVGAGIVKKTFSAEMVPLSDFLTTFGQITVTAP